MMMMIDRLIDWIPRQYLSELFVAFLRFGLYIK